MGGIDAELAPTLSTFWNKGRIVALNPANRVPLLYYFLQGSDTAAYIKSIDS